MATPLETEGDLRSEINVTPLVDVMLVLLVIFMVVTPLLRQEIPVSLPEAEQSESTAGLSQVTLTLASDGSVRLDGETVTRNDLLTELRSRFANRADKSIYLESDRALPYGEVVDLMDLCREAGIAQIGVLTKRPAAVGG